MDVFDVLYLFYRPNEPLFYPKKVDGNTVIFDIPVDFLTDEWKDQPVTILNRFGSTDCRRIDLGSYVTEDIYELDLAEVITIDRKNQFSQFVPKHQKAAAHLVELFLSQKNFDTFMVYAAYCRDRVNSELYIYALSIALIHREDTQNVALPAYWQIFPEKFINASVMHEMRTAAQLHENSSEQLIEIPTNFTGTDGDPEHRLAYWREDIGISMHHWHWHLLYPTAGPKVVVDKDRSGEIFFYMHRQIISRYNVERLCHGLNYTEPFKYWNVPMRAYFPKLYHSTSAHNWPGRPAGLILKDIYRVESNLVYDMADMERWRTRIFDAIHLGYGLDKAGNKVQLDAKTGVDVLGSIVAGNALSINRRYYGHLHNYGHFAIAYVHDPKGIYLEHAGIMVDAVASMRDPMFYEWHGYVDEILYEFKDMLKPYTNEELDFPEIEVVNIGLSNLYSSGSDKSKKENPKLRTFYQTSDLNLSNGLDFTRAEPIYVRLTHLNHDEFMYTIEVNNKNESEKYGTVRIFIAPAYAFDGSNLKLSDQRKLMIEMDKFAVKLQPGQNKILRKSTESSTTIPYEQTFRDLRKNRPPNNEPDNLDSINFCGCGWPQHMLLPIGTTSGYSMQLFIMISNFEDDKVEKKVSKTVTCQVGVNVCGLKNQKYPDKREMGYPFDRIPARGINTLHDFLKPNMKSIDFTIVHDNTIQ